MNASEAKTKLLDALQKMTQQMNERIADKIDVDYIKSLEPRMQYLQGKLDRKEPLSASDIREMLLIQRNIIVPALMKQEVNRLEAAHAMLQAAEVK